MPTSYDVTILVEDDSNPSRILVVWDPTCGTWELPSFKRAADDGETFEEAAVRGLEELTGLTGEAYRQVLADPVVEVQVVAVHVPNADGARSLSGQPIWFFEREAFIGGSIYATFLTKVFEAFDAYDDLKEVPPAPPAVTDLADLADLATSLMLALAPLVAIADAYDANELDDEARKRWGKNLEHENVTPPDAIEIYSGRGGKELLTLAVCLHARVVVNAWKRLKELGP